MKFSALPRAARIYIVLVIAAGVALAAWSAMHRGFGHPLLLVALLALSVLVHTVKIEFTAASSTFSIGYAVAFASLLALGPAGAIWVAMVGALVQCTLNVKIRTPWYQTVFSMSVLGLSIEAAGRTLAWMGAAAVNGPADIVIPSLMAAALAYFLVNSLLMATVIALTTGRPPIRVWDRDFLWGAPNYFIGALVATVAVQSASRFGVTSVVLLVALLLLTFRLYNVFVRRLDEALTDPLTHLPNRRSLAAHAEAEIARASRSGEALAIVMADVNRFKQINDTYGHQKGDEVLELIADGFRRGLRPYDFCARYAGDEFVLLLPGCTGEMAGQRAESLAETIAAAPFTLPGGGASSVTISVGVASFPDDGRSYEDLLAVADARMYRRKALEKPSAGGL